jgi:hypothetical protein
MAGAALTGTALTTGCDGDRVLLHNSVLPGPTAAIAIGGDGDDIHVQRTDGTLARLATRNGRELEVFDPLTTEPERLLDLYEADGNARALAVSDDALFIWRDSLAEEPLRQDADGGAGVVYGAFCGGGFVIVRPPFIEEGDEDPEAPPCQAEFHIDDDVFEVALPEEACETTGALAADPLEPVAWLAGQESAWLLTPDDVTTLDSAGDMAVFDPTINGVVIGLRGGRELEAWAADGTSPWYIRLNQEIRGITSLGTAGAIAIITSPGVGGTISLLDAATGDGIMASATPTVGKTISGSQNGDMLALGLNNEVHTFLVRLRNGK